MKKYIVLSLCIMMMAFFAGCGSHSYFDTWSADITQHWHDCMDCDKDADRGDHELDENSCCTVCGSSVYVNDDGSANVITYDNYGAMIANVEYDAEGEIYYFQRFENEYYEDGNPKQIKEYVFDLAFDAPGEENLVMESSYLPCENPENGDVYCDTMISYEESGKSVMTNNEEGRPVSVAYYDAEDQMIAEETYEYVYDDQGNLTNQKTYTNGVLSAENPQTYDDDGNLIEYAYINYNEDGSISSQSKYDAEGNEIE